MGWKAASSLLLAAALLTATSSDAEGLPEPPIVVYGQVRDHTTGARITAGSLTWTWQPVNGGNPVTLTTMLSNINDQFSYVLFVPCESALSGQTISLNTLTLANPNVSYLRDDARWNSQPLVFKESSQGVFTLSAIARGVVERIDLGVGEFPLDSDGDGIPDWWKALYPEASNPDEDTDGDGLTNREEYLAGTDPTDPDSSLRFVNVTEESPGVFLIQWSSVPGRSYSILRAPNLSINPRDYELIQSGIPSEGDITSFHDYPLQGTWFYRVRVVE